MTVWPCARLVKVPLIKPRPVFFTTVRFVPVGGAKFSPRLTVPFVAVKLLAVTGTLEAVVKVAAKAWGCA
jgi:hypothetical protein